MMQAGAPIPQLLEGKRADSCALPFMCHISLSAAPLITAIHLCSFSEPCREMIIGGSYVSIWNLPLLLSLSKSLLAVCGESEIVRRKEIDSKGNTSPLPHSCCCPSKSLLARLQKARWRGEEWESSQQGDSSQGSRKLPMLFFSNPFLISGFETRGWERVRRQE